VTWQWWIICSIAGSLVGQLVMHWATRVPRPPRSVLPEARLVSRCPGSGCRVCGGDTTGCRLDG
jgi:hypothetical protein